MGEIGMLWRGAKTVENSHFIYCFKNFSLFSLKEKESEKKKKKKKKISKAPIEGWLPVG